MDTRKVSEIFFHTLILSILITEKCLRVCVEGEGGEKRTSARPCPRCLGKSIARRGLKIW